jgi:uncharacterized protein with von Willebrand factor type A (vWA) domain
MRDVWALLAKANPKMLPKEAVRTDHIINHEVNSAIMEDPQYEELSFMTMGDPVGAALATKDLAPALIKLYERNKKLQDKLKEQQQAEEERLKKLVEAANAEGMGDQEEADSLQAEADAMGEDIAKAMKGIEHELDGAGTAMQSVIGKAMQKALDGQEAQFALARGFDLSKADLLRQDPLERVKFAKLLDNERIRKAAEFFGALVNLTRQRTRRRRGIPHETIGVMMGSEIDRLLTEQLALLDDPDLEMIFLADFADGRLLQYDVEGSEKVGKGGMAVGVDCSGSMQGAPLSWAVAVTLVLFGIACREKRAFRLVCFNTRVLQEIELTDRANIIENIGRIASISASGGTSFQAPLENLLAGLEGKASENACDLVFITDGQAFVDPEWQETFHKRMKKIGGKMWGIAINDYGDGEPLNSLCEGRVCPVSDLRPSATKNIKTIFDGVTAHV